jgi:M6 family metalloprotease-like protein
MLRMTSKKLPWQKMFHGSLVLVLLLVTLGTGAAAQDAPPDERLAADPYDQWSEEFFDFAPPTTNPLEVTQPDGSTFEAQLTAMEIGGKMETAEGYTILQNEAGWWTYAVPQEGSADPAANLAPSNLIVGKDLPQGLEKKLGRTPPIWQDQEGNDKRNSLFQAIHDTSSPNNSIFTVGDVEPKVYRYVVILVQYQDVKFEPYQTREWFQERLSGLGTSPTGSLTDFYFENSYGHFMPLMDVYGPITSDYNMAKFDYQLPGGWSVSSAINNEIGEKAKALGINWDQYDNDRVVYTSGGSQYRSVDMVVLLHAGPGKEATGIAGQIWSHASNANFRTGTFGEDGRELRIRAANTCPAIGFNIGVTAHEMGHSIGESDYYATSYNNAGTGDWEIMAGGSWMGDDPAGSNPTHFNPFSKINQGWTESIKVMDTTTDIELGPRSVVPDIIEIPLGGSGRGSGGVGADERIYVEYISNRVPGAIFDKAAYGSGLLIWHYDAGGSQNNPARERMAVLEYDSRDGTQELRLNLNRGEPTDPWLDTVLGATPYTEPSTNRDTPLAAGGTLQTGWYIMNISALGPTMKLDIVQSDDVTGQLGVDRPALVQQPVIAGTGPAELSTKVYNLTDQPLHNVQVEFSIAIGDQQAKIAETAVDTLNPGPPALVTATWAGPIAGKFVLTARATVDAAAATEQGMLRVFDRQAPVLIVDDDDGYTAEDAFEGVLTSLGVPYVLVEHTAGLALLSQYDLVIWSAGQAGRQQGQLNLQEIADLKAYLNAGGKLWMSSPRLAAALASTGSAAGVDPEMLSDYFGALYPMSSQAGGGTIYGVGHPIGGTETYALRPFPGRAIEDFLLPAESTIGTVSPLFTWSYGDYLGMEVIGDEAHNGFRVVYFGFNLSQVISGADRLALTQQVLDRMDEPTVYFDMNTYLMQTSGAIKVTLHDVKATAPVVTVRSDAQPDGLQVALKATEVPGTFTAPINIQKTNSKGNGLKVNNTDHLYVDYQDSLGRGVWATADVLTRVDRDLPPTLHHDLIDVATDAKDLPVMAVVTDDIRVQQVELYYRVAGSGSFIRMPMPATFRDAYTAVIPASAVTPMGVEYYIVARDSKGNLTYRATPDEPQFVVIQPRTLGQ